MPNKRENFRNVYNNQDEYIEDYYGQPRNGKYVDLVDPRWNQYDDRDIPVNTTYQNFYFLLINSSI